METLGHVYRKVEPDLFSCLVHQIIGQQISMAAQKTIWQRLLHGINPVTPKAIDAMSIPSLGNLGISPRKAAAIKGLAAGIQSGPLDISALYAMDDQEVIRILSSFQGIGVWTAQMALIFSMQRPDVLSFGDMGIQKGLRMLYHHRKITPALFAKYKKRYSPHGSVASLYLWEIAGGNIPGMRDYQPQKS
ncbi:MAG: DNA-3-methyladenine glycosidase [Desulfobacterales bacterium]|nr:MAG: DNA-3-methyladenine glycosidase [Desulfobacterales bacterium]